jgi:CRP-like cAMP-binding protein
LVAESARGTIMQKNPILTNIVQRHPDVRVRLKRVDFVHGDLFGAAGQAIEQVVFPVSGMISLVVPLTNGDQIEAGMVGHDGSFGGSVAFGAVHHLNSGFAQLPGTAYVLPHKDLIDIAAQDEHVRHMLFAYEAFVLAQGQQTAACNARHHILQRLSSWLLRAQAATGVDDMVLTQEFLAQMLGVQRASVSGFAARLQDMDLIRYRRGRLSILDRDGLARQACECHARLETQRRSLMDDAGDPFRATA